MLNSDEAVKAFSRGGNVTVGGEFLFTTTSTGDVTDMITGGISAAAGPVGTGGNISASLANPAPMFSYSRSKGELHSLVPNSADGHHRSVRWSDS